jgi:CYTH domain-containing protein
MTGQTGTRAEPPIREGKYARIERERRFLLARPPSPSAVAARCRLIDRYLAGTRLRLRRIDYTGSEDREFKLTQKVPSGQPGFIQGLITTTYLSAAEYDLLATLPGAVMCKTRLSVPPLSVNVFEPPLHGLIIADAEFTTDEEARSFLSPPGAVAEVTDDSRFTGGSLMRASRQDLLAWLTGYGIDPHCDN